MLYALNIPRKFCSSSFFKKKILITTQLTSKKCVGKYQKYIHIRVIVLKYIKNASHPEP